MTDRHEQIFALSSLLPGILRSCQYTMAIVICDFERVLVDTFDTHVSKVPKNSALGRSGRGPRSTAQVQDSKLLSKV
jgi:hypothetical protein